MTRLLYSAAWALALPLALLRLWWRGRNEPGYRLHVGERLALFPRRHGTAQLLWIHAVSVGETRAAEPLVEALMAAYPSHGLLLSHMTPTGRATGAALFSKFGARVQQVYLPYDLLFLMHRFLKKLQPTLCVLIETEIWPNCMAACTRAGVPVVLVNARLSQRSLARAHRFGDLIPTAARQLHCVGAQTAVDAARITALGVPDVQVTGNIKFDVSVPEAAIALGLQWRGQFGARPVLLCASTRDGEEALLVAALAQVQLPADTLLLLVPRHPQRFEQVATLLQTSGLTVQRRSTLGTANVDPATTVVLGDSMGEMFAYCAACDVAFVGGSLLPLGGQNPIEPCALGKPVLFGPHTFNFAEVCEAAIDAGAALRVDDAVALLRAAGALLAAPARLHAMGNCAGLFASQHRGATARTMALLSPLINQATDTTGSATHHAAPDS